MDFANRIKLTFTSQFISFIIFTGGVWGAGLTNTLPSQACTANRDESWTRIHFILYLSPKETDTTT